MSITTNVKATALRKVYEYLDKDPVNNLPQLGAFIDKYVPADSGLDGQLSAIKSVLNNPDNNWYRLILDVFTNIDSGVRRAAFENLVINATLRHGEIHDSLTEKYDCNIPWAILMDPTSAAESGAKSTDYQAQETAKEYSDKCEEKVAAWAAVADELWACSGHCAACSHAGKE